MKFSKLKAFLTGKKVVDTIAEKGDGTVTLSAQQAEAVEALSGELETAQSALASANTDLETARTNSTTLQTSIDAHVAQGKAVRTALELPESATNEEVVTAISGLKTKIVALGNQPGSMGADPGKKGSDKVETGDPNSADKFRTSYDDEADAQLKEMGIEPKKSN